MSKKQQLSPAQEPNPEVEKTAPIESPYSVVSTDVRHLFYRLNGPSQELRQGDREQLREHLILVHAPLVEYCARNFINSGEPFEDLVQEGYLGLVKAVDRFDPEKGVRFSTYACHLINGEIRHYLRDLARLIHEPAWHFELRQRILRTKEQLSQKLGRAPEPEEIAHSLDIEAKTVRDVLRAQHSLTVEDLDLRADLDSDESGLLTDWQLRATSAAAGPGIPEIEVESQMMLAAALPQLRDLEKNAVTLFYFEELTKTEIARRLGVSINHVGYLIKRGLEGLRKIIDRGEGDIPAEDTYLAALKRISRGRLRAASLLGTIKDEKQPVRPTTRSRRESARAQKLMREIATSFDDSPLSGICTFGEFVLRVDEEVLRARSYAQEFSLLWLRILNWDEVVQQLDEEEELIAREQLSALTRHSCRATDIVGSFSTPEFAGLHFLILMPHTGTGGQKMYERWQRNYRNTPLLSGDKTIQQELVSSMAFAHFPGDGKCGEELFHTLGEQLRKAETSLKQGENKQNSSSSSSNNNPEPQ